MRGTTSHFEAIVTFFSEARFTINNVKNQSRSAQSYASCRRSEINPFIVSMQLGHVSLGSFDTLLSHRATSVQAIVLPVFRGQTTFEEAVPFSRVLSEEDSRSLREFLSSRRFRGIEGKTVYLSLTSGLLAVVVGVGKRTEYEPERLRRVGSFVFPVMQDLAITNAAFCVPSVKLDSTKKSSDAKFIGRVSGIFDDETSFVRAYLEGVYLGSYAFVKYKSEHDRPFSYEEVAVVVDQPSSELEAIIEETLMVCEVIKEVRDLVNDSSDEVTPESFASRVRDFGKEYGFRVDVMDEEAIQKKGLNLLYAVGRTSAHQPRFVVASYDGGKDSRSKNDSLALIGKGVTYDTGGINLKSSFGGYLEQMRTDMAGAATVLGALMVACRLKLPIPLVAVMPLAENALGGDAYKPGDILRSYSGSTVEVINTDAEGRLLLADALTYTLRDLKVKNVIDVATLTGACIAALGATCAGLVSNDERFVDVLTHAGERTYERVWRMPLYQEHRDDIKSAVADIRNVNIMGGGRHAAISAAAAFVEHFIEDDTRWAHIDIAGTAYVEQKIYYSGPGATGFGVRLLVDALQEIVSHPQHQE